MNKKTMYGIDIYKERKNELLIEIENDLKNKKKITIMSINPEILMKAQKDKGLHETLKGSEYNIPDGIGTLVLAKRKGMEIKERIAGYEMFEELLEIAEKTKKGVFLYGATEEVNQMTKENVIKKYPAIQIAGACNGFRNDKEQVVKEINQSGACFLFIAMGAPHQEKFIQQYQKELNVELIQPVGGSFDVMSGRVKRAPLWTQKIHMEWFYRMVTDIKRIKRVSSMLLFVTKEMVKRGDKNE